MSPFPAAVEDCQSAVAWLRRQAERFGIDPTRIGAIGSSAGGHLAACMGVMDESIGGISAKVNCVVDVHGVHDFPALLDTGEVINENWQAFLGGPYTDRQPAWIHASPALHVDGSSASMLIVHDPKDDLVPYEQSRLLVDALVRTGRPVQFLPSPGSGHGFFYDPENPWAKKVWSVVVIWLGQQLLGSIGQDVGDI
jgi:acetyl esterase/lipase